MAAALRALARSSRWAYNASGSAAAFCAACIVAARSGGGFSRADSGVATTAIYNKKMQDIIRQLLAELGEDPSREGLLNTPKRVEKSLRFLTSGYAADIDQVLNNALFSVDYSEMVIVKDVDF